MPGTLRHFLDAIKFEHTVFALPFAYVAMVLAADGWPGWRVAIWVTLAMAGARTLAMSVNRFADRLIDADNPRTARRHLPQGLLKPWHMLAAAILSAALLALSAWKLNPLCFKLAPWAALFLIGYSYTKRFTWASHWILGFTDGIAAAGGWIAVRGAFDPPAFVLWFALTVWIAGFGLIYACQDAQFDVGHGLHSVPARIGVGPALRLAAACHLGMILALFALVWVYPYLGSFYVFGILAVAALIAWEHWLVRPDDLSRVNLAFFHVNAVVSLGLLVVGMLDLLF